MMCCRPLQAAFSGPLPPPPPVPPPPALSAPLPPQQLFAPPASAPSPMNAELARRAAEHLRAAHHTPEQGQLLMLPDPPPPSDSALASRPDLKRKWDVREDSPADDLPPGVSLREVLRLNVGGAHHKSANITVCN